MSEKKKKKVLSQTLEDFRRNVDKTEFEPVEGVYADALDVAEVGDILSRLVRKVKAPNLPAPTIPLPATVQLPPNLILETEASKLAKVLNPVAKRLPPAQLAALMYETAALANSEEAQEKAREQAEGMYKRGYSLEGVGKNALQGFLDPAGTVYAAGDAIVDTAKTVGGLAYDKFFDPSEEEQREAAKFRMYKRNRDRDAALRNARMSPEERAESADRAIARPDQGDLQKKLRSGASSVRSPNDKKADDLRKLMEKPYDGLTSLMKRPR
jgi:hypothetical protein